MWRVPPSLSVGTIHVGNKTSCCEYHPAVVLTLNNITYSMNTVWVLSLKTQTILLCHHFIFNLCLFLHFAILLLTIATLTVNIWCSDFYILQYPEGLLVLLSKNSVQIFIRFLASSNMRIKLVVILLIYTLKISLNSKHFYHTYAQRIFYSSCLCTFKDCEVFIWWQ